MNNEESSNSTPYSDDSTQDFFEAMESNVNSMVEEESNNNNQPIQQEKTLKKANNTAKGPQRVDWKKRYQDSSREAKRMHSEMQTLKPYAAIIEAMKKEQVELANAKRMEIEAAKKKNPKKYPNKGFKNLGNK